MQLITPEELCRKAKISRTTLWRYRRRFADFPKPILLNGDNPRWVSHEVDQWLLSLRETPERAAS